MSILININPKAGKFIKNPLISFISILALFLSMGCGGADKDFTPTEDIFNSSTKNNISTAVHAHGNLLGTRGNNRAAEKDKNYPSAKIIQGKEQLFEKNKSMAYKLNTACKFIFPFAVCVSLGKIIAGIVYM